MTGRWAYNSLVLIVSGSEIIGRRIVMATSRGNMRDGTVLYMVMHMYSQLFVRTDKGVPGLEFKCLGLASNSPHLFCSFRRAVQVTRLVCLVLPSRHLAAPSLFSPFHSPLLPYVRTYRRHLRPLSGPTRSFFSFFLLNSYFFLLWYQPWVYLSRRREGEFKITPIFFSIPALLHRSPCPPFFYSSFTLTAASVSAVPVHHLSQILQAV